MKRILKTCFVLFFVLYILLPIFTNIILSFSNVWQWPDLLPNEMTLRHYENILSQKSILKAIIDTVIVGGSVIGLNYRLVIPCAYALSRFSGPYKSFLIILIILP